MMHAHSRHEFLVMLGAICAYLLIGVTLGVLYSLIGIRVHEWNRTRGRTMTSAGRARGQRDGR